jgi:hypothetical protein
VANLIANFETWRDENPEEYADMLAEYDAEDWTDWP